MKFLCGKCDSRMECTDAEKEAGLSMRVTFSCPTCGIRIFLKTNPGETQLVHSLGVSIGERKAYTPLALTRSTIQEKTANPMWTDDAWSRLQRVPTFVRSMAKKAIENYACEKNYSRITSRVVEEARREIGM